MPLGTKLRFTLSQPATVKLRSRARRSGRGRARSASRPGGRPPGRKARCTLYVSAGSLTRRLNAGKNAVTFTGRVGKKALARGSYKLKTTAQDAARNTAKTIATTFTIVAPSKR